MATHWRGWEGEKTWKSIEGDLSLACTSDNEGHIVIRIELGSRPLADWRTRERIVVKAGQLDRLAKTAAKVIDEDKPEAGGL